MSGGETKQRISLTELERAKMAEAGRQSIPCQHGWRPMEAADEIERLRGLLKNWVDCCFVNFATDTIEIVDVGKVYVETRAAIAKATGGE